MKHTESDSECYSSIPNRIQIRKSPVGLRGGKGKRHSLAERLAARTIVGEKPDDCWIFQGWRNGPNGYGQIQAEWPSRKTIYAHRAAWMLANGESLIPDGMRVLHSCDNPRCVNPAHLSLGTQADNIRDAHTKGRFTAWHRTGVRLNGLAAKRHPHLLHNSDVPAQSRSSVLKGLDRSSEILNRRHSEVRLPPDSLGCQPDSDRRVRVACS